MTSEAPIERPPPGEEVVITGVSGVFPAAPSVAQFARNLYDKVDMVSDRHPRWRTDHPEIPNHLAVVDSMGKFDAQFFRVHYKQALTLEPMSRKLLEHTYSAIYDAGINPCELRGKKVGVFIGSTFSESEKPVIYENIQRNGLGITGCNKAMYANRISYWLDSKGPSYALDAACASSLVCVQQATAALAAGECDAALVGGCNLCMHPSVALNGTRASLLTTAGRTRCFDRHCDGYVRADAVCLMLLQKKKDAKRAYCEVYHAKSWFSGGGAGGGSGLVRDSDELRRYLQDFYAEIDVAPHQVEYIEANGAAIKEADVNEVRAIGAVFAQEKPVMIGCVKSNMGSSEPASGVCALTKACLAFQNGQVPGNLHYEVPLDIPEINDGKVQVVTDNTDIKREFIAVNSFSYTGVNVHVLLKGHYKRKDIEKYKTNIPYLVLMSGRQNACVSSALQQLKSSPLDPEQVALLHNIHKHDVPGHMSRGFALLSDNAGSSASCVGESVEYYPGERRPLWFVYSGMGSQWAGMGARLMDLPIFAAAIHRCHKVLEPKGIDIVKIITNPDKTTFDNILHSFVGIAAVQIGLTDILTAVGITPDYIIGHSVGELGCGYADGCFTAEEMILCAYSRGLVSVQTPFIRGSMAAVGLGHAAAAARCPPEVQVACHNSADSCTISGPADIMRQFVAQLTSEGIFAKEVPCSNIAFHSKYIASAGEALREYLRAAVPQPRRRSARWVSTSVPRDRWHEPVAQYCSAEYHTNNLLSPVLFEESAALIPANSVVVEVAPHGLLQAILKRSHAECLHVSVAHRGAPDPAQHLLHALGKLYEAGFNLDVAQLYPKIEFPVSSETPPLSQLVEWEHGEDWPEAKYSNKEWLRAAVCDMVVSVHEEEYAYLRGHLRAGHCLLPAAALLHLAWRTAAMAASPASPAPASHLPPVTFHDLRFHGAVPLHPHTPCTLQVMIHKGSSKFEITYDNTTVASGVVQLLHKSAKHRAARVQQDTTNDGNTLNWLAGDDIYTMMSLNGYTYKEEFRSIVSMSSDHSEAYVKWSHNWVTFVDSLLQLNMVASVERGAGGGGVALITALTIHPEEQPPRDTELRARIHPHTHTTVCGGVTMRGVVFDGAARGDTLPDVMLHTEFMPHRPTRNMDMETCLEVNMQIIRDNVCKKEIKITDLSGKGGLLREAARVCSVSVRVTEHCGDADAVLHDQLLRDTQTMQRLHEILPHNKFVLTLEDKTTDVSEVYEWFNVISVMNVGEHAVVLLRHDLHRAPRPRYHLVPVTGSGAAVSAVMGQRARDSKLVLTCNMHEFTQHHGTIMKVMQEYGEQVCVVVMDRTDGTPLDPTHALYTEQLNNNLNINVLKEGEWGGYYQIPTDGQTLMTNVVLNATQPGNLESAVWIEQCSTAETRPTVKVQFAGVTALDVELRAHELGLDYSGIDHRGQRVMGAVCGGAVATEVRADALLTWPVPAHWSLEDAATVPLPYAYAYYCLVVRYAVCGGESVLVHGEGGPLEQALIAVCLSLHCTVYATVSHHNKKQHLLKLFPQLNDQHVGTHVDDILPAIRGGSAARGGCDLVLNRRKGPSRLAALNCVGFMGCFLDLNNHDMRNNSTFGMSFLFSAKNYSTAHITSLFNNDEEKKVVQALVCEGIARGTVRPLPRVVFERSAVRRALRPLLAAGGTTGRVLVRVAGDAVRAAHRIRYSSTDSYMVSSDDPVIGVEMVDRLVVGGARRVLLHLERTSPLSGGGGGGKRRRWERAGAHVTVHAAPLAEAVRAARTARTAYVVQRARTRTAQHTLHALRTIHNNCQQIERLVLFEYWRGEDEWEESATAGVSPYAGEGVLHYRVRLQHPEDEAASECGRARPVPLAAALLGAESAARARLHTLTAHHRAPDMPRAPTHEPGGLAALLGAVLEDEILAGEPLVPLATMFDTAQGEEQFDPSANYLMVLPGMEGHCERLSAVCEGLKMPAMGCQYGPELCDADIPQHAAYILKYMKKRFKLNSKFYLLGSSFGVNVALELAALLEQHGHVGVVYCVDCSPAVLRARLDALLGHLSESALQVALAEHMYALMGGTEVASLRRELHAAAAWEDKVRACLNRLRSVAAYSHQYKSCMLRGAYSRVRAARTYEPAFTLQSEVVVVATSSDCSVPPEYGLERVSARGVRVLRAPAPTALASVVNSTLPPELRRAFNERNLCFTYTPTDKNTIY